MYLLERSPLLPGNDRPTRPLAVIVPPPGLCPEGRTNSEGSNACRLSTQDLQDLVERADDLQQDYALVGFPPRLPIYPLYSTQDLPDLVERADDLRKDCALVLAFFGSMRAGEFTCPSHTAFSSAMLTVGDVAVDSHISPTRMTVLVKQSKTDSYGAGTTLQFGDYLCPVTVMLGYLAVRHHSLGPLFVFEDGATLSRARLVQSLHN